MRLDNSPGTVGCPLIQERRRERYRDNLMAVVIAGDGREFPGRMRRGIEVGIVEVHRRPRSGDEAIVEMEAVSKQ